MEPDLNQKLAAYGMRLEFWKVSDLQKLAEKTKNPKKHFNKDIDALVSSIDDLGFKSAVYINKDATEIGAGVGRIMASARRGMDELPVFRILDLDKIKFKKFRIADNRINQMSNKWDDDVLLADLRELANYQENIEWMYFSQFDKILSSEDAVEVANYDLDLGGPLPFAQPSQELGGRPVTNSDLQPHQTIQQTREAETAEEPEDLSVDFSSSNDWGIPDLDLRFQSSGVHLPFVKWGEISYKKVMNGTWHFYVDDPKFDRIASDPTPALRSMPTDLVELNFSTSEFLPPPALAIGDIFFKRWVSRFWQSKGFNVIVDLNVHPRFRKMNLIGVPEGWKAYATRGSGELEFVMGDWQTACDHAGCDESDIIFIVYGGGKQIRETAQSKGWHWIPERMAVTGDPSLAGLDGLDIKVSPGQYQDL